MTESEHLYNYAGKRAGSKAFQILHNVSIVHTLFPNKVRVNKIETKIQKLKACWNTEWWKKQMSSNKLREIKKWKCIHPKEISEEITRKTDI